MKYFDVRFSSQLVAPSAWPAEAPPLVLLDLPEKLHIPILAAESRLAFTPLPTGTCVTKGQPLFVQDDLSAHAVPLAPTSGRVTGVSRVMLITGRSVPAIDLEPDFEDRPGHIESHDTESASEQQALLESLEDLRPGDLPRWIQRLATAGIWSDRPGSPDLLAQLRYAARQDEAAEKTPADQSTSTPKRQPIDTIICNLLDDEPALRINSILAARSGPMLLAGLRLLGRLTRAAHIWMIVEGSAPSRWWGSVRKLIKRTRVEIVPLQNDYPQSDSTLLIHTLLSRRLKPGRLPVEKGVLMLDAAAAIAVGRCAARGQPMLQSPLAVRDHLHNRTHLLVVPIGTRVRDVLRHGPTISDDVKILRGGALHENVISPDAIIAGGELTLHVMPKTAPALADPCIRCSWCVESCPTRVQPAGLLEACQRGDRKMAKRFGLDACIECGVCTYVCPSRLPLLEGIRKLKAEFQETTRSSETLLNGLPNGSTH